MAIAAETYGRLLVKLKILSINPESPSSTAAGADVVRLPNDGFILPPMHKPYALRSIPPIGEQSVWTTGSPRPGSTKISRIPHIKKNTHPPLEKTDNRCAQKTNTNSRWRSTVGQRAGKPKNNHWTIPTTTSNLQPHGWRTGNQKARDAICPLLQSHAARRGGLMSASHPCRIHRVGKSLRTPSVDLA